MMRPKLSICVPTYNRAGFLDALLDHLFVERPVACDFELVVSDNSSNDHTNQVIQSCSADLLRQFAA